MNILKKWFVKSWKDVRNNLSLYVPDIVATLFVLSLLGLLFFSSGALPFLESLESIEDEEQIFTLLKDAVTNNLNMILTYSLLWFVISFIITLGAKAVKLGMMREIVLKKKPSLRKTKQYLQRYFKKLVGLNLLLLFIFAVIFLILCFIIVWLVQTKAASWIIVLVGLLALVIFVWVLLKLFFSQIALVLENKSITDALKSSNKFFMTKKMAVIKVLLLIFVSFLVMDIISSFIEKIPVIGDVISILLFIAIGLWASLFMLEVYNGRKKVK